MKMNFIFKKFSAALLIFTPVFFMAVALAPTLKGQVPEVEPLQPIPAYIKPNIEKNISRNAETEAAAPTSDGTNALPANNVPTVPTPEVIAQETPAPISEPAQSLLLWVVVAGVVIALVLVVLGVRHHYKAKNNWDNNQE